MAISANAIWEVETGGSDTNGGGFDPSQTSGMQTNGAITSANTASPVLSSATYTFTAGDVGAWAYLPLGTNIIAGWYKIASVSAGAATLSAAIGAGVLSSTQRPTTALGCGTAATLSGITWTVDYSQRSTPYATFTISGIGTTITPNVSLSGGYVNLVGNVMYITGGGATTGFYTITAAGALTLTIDRTAGTITAGSGAAGGALASLGQASANLVAGNTLFQQSGAYTITSATTNISGGCASIIAGGSATTTVRGYGSVRGDGGTKPVNTASGISTFKFMSLLNLTAVDNIGFDGASLTSGTGFFTTSAGVDVTQCRAVNCTNSGFSLASAGTLCLDCVASNCTTVAAFVFTMIDSCVAIGGVTGFSGSAANCLNCIAINTTSHGFASAGNNVNWRNCDAYGCGGNGFSSANTGMNFQNCIAENCSGTGFAMSSPAGNSAKMFNCATFNNTSGATLNIPSTNIFGLIQYSASAFVAPTASPPNMNLNNTAGGGALLRAASFVGVFPTPADITATSYLDRGAVQSQASAASGGGGSIPMSGGMQG
jgi:hypothetical protein